MNLLFCSSVFTFYLCLCTLVVSGSHRSRRLAVDYDDLSENQDMDEDDFMADQLSNSRSYAEPITKKPVKIVSQPPVESYTYPQTKAPSYDNQKKVAVVKKTDQYKVKEVKKSKPVTAGAYYKKKKPIRQSKIDQLKKELKQKKKELKKLLDATIAESKVQAGQKMDYIIRKLEFSKLEKERQKEHEPVNEYTPAPIVLYKKPKTFKKIKY